ncbi:MAG: phage holin family protein [Clostridia bacterium]|nr:phage holin family protein [Clostridia bacterium]
MEKMFNSISIAFGVIGGLIVSFLGGWDGLAITLVSFIVLDWITGLLKAIYNKNLSSYTGFKGIIKKVVILIVVGVAVLLEKNMGIPAIREIVMMFFIANEGISLLENVSQMGIPFPEKLKDILIQLRNKKGE